MGETIFVCVVIIAISQFIAWRKGTKFNFQEFIKFALIYTVGIIAIRIFINIFFDWLPGIIPIYNQLSELEQFTVQGILFFCICCAISIVSWRRFNKQKETIE